MLGLRVEVGNYSVGEGAKLVSNPIGKILVWNGEVLGCSAITEEVNPQGDGRGYETVSQNWDDGGCDSRSLGVRG
jgi:hypothetical protein